MAKSAHSDAAIVWMLRKAAKDGLPITITIDGKLYTIAVKPAPEEL